jgi:hypothetical protein
MLALFFVPFSNNDPLRFPVPSLLATNVAVPDARARRHARSTGKRFIIVFRIAEQGTDWGQ